MTAKNTPATIVATNPTLTPAVEIEPLKLTRKDLIELVTAELEESLDDACAAARVEYEKVRQAHDCNNEREVKIESGKLFKMCQSAAKMWTDEPLTCVMVELGGETRNNVRMLHKEPDAQYNGPGYRAGGAPHHISVLKKYIPAKVVKLEEKRRASYKLVTAAQDKLNAAGNARREYDRKSKKIVQKLVRQELRASIGGKAVLDRVEALKNTVAGGIKALPSKDSRLLK